jgi:antitoxin component YwqK of YwqJK toxin-antitoxin module
MTERVSYYRRKITMEFSVILTISIAVLVVTVACLIIFLILRPKEKREFYDTGELKFLYYLKKDRKIGKETIYYRTGEINRIKHWDKKGELYGESIVFYRTGEKYIVSNYLDNELDGEYTVYHKDGTVIESYNYNNGGKAS